jgi:Leucine-rich repeat (LRR) protein
MTFYFGLNVNRSLAEILNKPLSLKNLNLDINDLNIIRNISVSGVQRTDLQSLSGLTFDAEKISYAIDYETNDVTYPKLTQNIYDSRSFINTNLNIAGGLAAASFKYNYVDFDSNTIKSADISTSRASSWSTFESPSTENSPIFYGGLVTVEGSLELTNLSLSNNLISQRKYESEIPTHRIKTNIAGQNTYIYAMKGIPLVFDGFFRTANVSATINVLSGLRPSWVVKTGNTSTEYVNRLSGSVSTIVFNSSISTNRSIEFYYPPDRITNLRLSNINLSNLPKITLQNLSVLEISNNDFREFPDVSTFSSLTTLNISYNDLTRSPNTALKTFSSDVVSRIPSSIVSLNMGGTYNGPVANLDSLSNLTTLNLTGFESFNRAFDGESPKVLPNKIENYIMDSNRFTSISNSVLESTTLKTFNCSRNQLNQTDISFANASNIEVFTISSNRNTQINLVNLSGKSKLKNYNFTNNRLLSPTGNDVQNIFDGCSALETINFDNSLVGGRFPTLTGCFSLRSIRLLDTNITNASNNFVIDEATFDSCRDSLQELYWRTSQITNAPFNSNAFKNLYNLRILFLSANKRGLNGSLPSGFFSDLRSLVNVWLYNTNISGAVPTFPNSDNIFYFFGYRNEFTGAVPSINKPNFRYLYLHENKLSIFERLESTSLYMLYLTRNNLTNIPDLSNLLQLRWLYVDNNSISSYTAGALATQGNLRLVNLNNNNLSQGAVDQIFIDLNKNYDNLPRSGVQINITGPNNSAPSNNETIRDIISKLRNSGWQIFTN